MEKRSQTKKLWQEFKTSVSEKGWLNTITGSEFNKEWAPLKARAKALPEDYQEVWLHISAQYWGKGKGGTFDNRKDLEFFDGILMMLEEGVAEGMPATAMIGEDGQVFAEEITGIAEGQDYRDKWRQELNETVMKKLGRGK